MEIRPVILVLADISGYTRFIKYHRVSLIHAEKIITDLLESVISSADRPLVLHELEGDAVSFYAIEEGDGECAGEVFAQVERFVDAFRQREAELISDCTTCECEACERVGQLKIKVVLHRGRALFTRVRQFKKVAGEDVIIAHRLLKNSVPSKEYILMTEPFVEACSELKDRPLESRTEHPEGLDEMPVYILNFDQSTPIEAAERSTWDRVKMFAKLEGYTVRRFLFPSRRTYRNLPDD